MPFSSAAACGRSSSSRALPLRKSGTGRSVLGTGVLRGPALATEGWSHGLLRLRVTTGFQSDQMCAENRRSLSLENRSRRPENSAPYGNDPGTARSVLTSVRVLHLPDWLAVVGNEWFSDSSVEKLIVSGSVGRFGSFAFSGCSRLEEIVFEKNSRLEVIGCGCFSGCGRTRMTIPRSVREIHMGAF